MAIIKPKACFPILASFQTFWYKPSMKCNEIGIFSLYTKINNSNNLMI